MEETIFVQIAAYRDPELVPTVKDCIAKADNPENLHICIGWQYGPDDDISGLASLSKKYSIRVINIPYAESRGACWIRRIIQDQYVDETFTLQLDSHHRFIKGWDTKLKNTLHKLVQDGFAKPLLTSYLPSYDPKNDPDGRINEPWQINFDRFLPQGPIFFRPSTLRDYKTLTGPVLARALSAHFIFTEGEWCKKVRYDPELYFHGEEISLAVRSFTHGYDLFHPHEVIIWHQYTRAGVKKHWDDSKIWSTLNDLSYKRVKILLGIAGEDPNQIDFGECGLGTVRTLKNFEIFAGVDFKNLLFHDDTVKEILPPIKFSSPEEYQRRMRPFFKHCIDVLKSDLPEKDYDFWCVVFKDKEGVDMYRKDADENEIKSLFAQNESDLFIHIWREFDSPERPSKLTIWPHSKSKGWETKLLNQEIQYT